ncbi:hypothetical protein GCM10023324_12390 [Streptomyces youssoufiensis]
MTLGWAPPAGGLPELLPTGREWDAVRTSAAVATWAFNILDGRRTPAATIIDTRNGTAIWLIPPGEAAHAPWWQWGRLQPRVTVLPSPPTGLAYVGVPAADRQAGPGLHWRVPPDWDGRYIAAPGTLAEALAPAIIAVHGPEALAMQCRVCRRAVPRADAVTALGRLTADDPYPQRLVAHRECARHMIVEECSA